jgi:hypothetical protein
MVEEVPRATYQNRELCKGRASGLCIAGNEMTVNLRTVFL